MPDYYVENPNINQAFLVRASDTKAACECLGWTPSECIFWVEFNVPVENLTEPVPVNPRPRLSPDNSAHYRWLLLLSEDEILGEAAVLERLANNAEGV